MPPKQQSRKTKSETKKSTSRKRSPTPTPSSSSSILRISPGNPELESPRVKLTEPDIKQIIHDLVYNNDVFEALRTKKANIDKNSVDILLTYINKKTPREYREALTRIDLLENYQREVREDTDKELLKWIVKEIAELLLHGIRDMGKMIITKKLITPFMERNDFVNMLDE
jgi:hypothetical protein